MSQASADPDARENPAAPKDDDALLLPTKEERTWILEQLAELVSRRGHEHLTLAPLVVPDETYFPDPWRGGEASLRRLLRRLLVYADLEGAKIELVVHDDADVGGSVAPAGIGSLIWFVRRERDRLHFAARQSALKEPKQIVPAAARAVTEGFRSWHRLVIPDAVGEQRLVDVTTVFLGFGVLTTDARIRHGAVKTETLRLQRTKTQLGVLPTQALAFALATVAVVRDLDRKELRRIAKNLQPNPAEFLRESLDVLRRWSPPVREVLGVPDPATWPAAPDLADLTAPFDDDDGDPEAAEAEQPKEDKGVVGMNAGQPVFVVQRSKALRLAKMFALPVALLGMLAGRMNTGIDIEMWKIGAIAAGLGLLGLAIGRFLPDSRCSEPKCGTPLTSDMRSCPRCGGTIVGVIHHPKERLGAEEAWRAKNPGESSS